MKAEDRTSAPTGRFSPLGQKGNQVEQITYTVLNLILIQTSKKKSKKVEGNLLLRDRH